MIHPRSFSPTNGGEHQKFVEIQQHTGHFRRKIGNGNTTGLPSHQYASMMPMDFTDQFSIARLVRFGLRLRGGCALALDSPHGLGHGIHRLRLIERRKRLEKRMECVRVKECHGHQSRSGGLKLGQMVHDGHIGGIGQCCYHLQ